MSSTVGIFGGVLGHVQRAVMAWLACLAGFNERQLQRASDSVITLQEVNPRSGLLRHTMKTRAVAWWVVGGLHQHQIALCTEGLITYYKVYFR